MRSGSALRRWNRSMVVRTFRWLKGMAQIVAVFREIG
jgi:hypothetical protein